MNQDILLKETNIVKDAVKILEEKNVRGVFIVDDNMVLKGIFTQGDLRRFILKNGEMSNPIAYAMNKEPVTFHSREEAKSHCNIVCPVIDKDGKLTDILYNERTMQMSKTQQECLKDIPLVIMAGGLGKRLYPLTKILPKALIPIGDYTITERIIDNFKSWGCREVYIIINYKAEMIKAYFNEKEKDYKLHYIQEKEFMGTGGGLSLLKGKINSTFILSNCDILVDTDFDCVMRTHYKRKDDITFVGSYKNINIPYGVIRADNDGRIEELQEKPELSFLTNTGVYVIEPSVLEDMPRNEFFHITDFAMDYKKKGKQIGVFPITGNAWLDMGEIAEMKTMMKTLDLEE